MEHHFESFDKLSFFDGLKNKCQSTTLVFEYVIVTIGIRRLAICYIYDCFPIAFASIQFTLLTEASVLPASVKTISQIFSEYMGLPSQAS